MHRIYYRVSAIFFNDRCKAFINKNEKMIYKFKINLHVYKDILNIKFYLNSTIDSVHFINCLIIFK